MKLSLLAFLVPTVVAQKKCHSIMAGVKDDWCNQNCNFQPPFCPASICSCDGPGPTPPGPVPPGPVPPTPSPGPPPPPGPKPDLPDEIIGYYSWNWGAGSLGPPGSNMGVAFTGLVDVAAAIGAYSPDAGCPALKGLKTISLGGGNAAGVFNEAGLKGIIRDVAKIKEAGYSAVIFDVEEVPGPSSVMGPLFSKATAAAHEAGLISAITTSHSAPFQCDTPQDAINLVKEWCADPNLDIISPQLYSSGYEAKPELVPTNFCVAEGCTWDLYKNCKAEIAPSIIKTSHYEEVKAFFEKTIGRKMKGYYMWAQTRGREDPTITV